jgi:hypothetical protein
MNGLSRPSVHQNALACHQRSVNAEKLSGSMLLPVRTAGIATITGSHHDE